MSSTTALDSARSVKERFKEQLLALPGPGRPVPKYEQARHWIHYAKEFLAASEYLNPNKWRLLKPWVQVSGHAIECAIKAYLCASGEVVPKRHDLVTLIDLARNSCLSIETRGLAMMVHLDHLYSCDLRSVTKYKARYPSDHWEPFGGTVPEQEFLTHTVEDLCDQAGAVNDRLNRNDQTNSIEKGKR